MDALREWLSENGKTQKWLCGRLGITSQAMSQWHKVPSDYLPKICELTGIAPAKLRPDMATVLRSK